MNPSFEEMNRCCASIVWTNYYPVDPATFCIPNWFNPNLSSPDLFSKVFDTCLVWSWDTNYRVPKNKFGNQLPHDGKNYVGLGVLDMHPLSQDYREYILGSLTKPLKKQKKYCISFYISLADTCCYAIKKLGIYFSKDSLVETHSHFINVIPDAIDTNFIIDKINLHIL